MCFEWNEPCEGTEPEKNERTPFEWFGNKMRNIRAFASPFCLLSSLGICPAIGKYAFTSVRFLCVIWIAFDAFDEEGNEAKPNRNCVPFLVSLLLDFSMYPGIYRISVFDIGKFAFKVCFMNSSVFFFQQKNTHLLSLLMWMWPPHRCGSLYGPH